MEVVYSKFRFFLAAGCLLALSANAVAEEPVISVTILDNGSLFHRGVTASIGKTRVGKITFKVTNNSNWRTHSFVVLPMKEYGAELRIKEGGGPLYDYTRHGIGAIYDLAPGRTGALSLDLHEGTYILTCIRHGPYLNGMWTALTVE
jgi:uncharacterized cupredoxin-like copper-binding protein